MATKTTQLDGEPVSVEFSSVRPHINSRQTLRLRRAVALGVSSRAPKLSSAAQAVQVQITAMIIPVDEAKPMRQEQIDNRDWRGHQKLVGGTFEVVSLDEPEASLYCNDEALNLSMPLNRRASLIAAVHNSAFRGHSAIFGPAFLLGAVNDDGYTAGCPQPYLNLWFHVTEFRVEWRAKDYEWQKADVIYHQVTDAYMFAVNFGINVPGIDDVRVVAA